MCVALIKTLCALTITHHHLAVCSLPLKYSWSRADDQPFIKGTQFSDNNRVLTIANAPLEAEGDYICKVVRQGIVSKTATISLLLES